MNPENVFSDLKIETVLKYTERMLAWSDLNDQFNINAKMHKFQCIYSFSDIWLMLSSSYKQLTCHLWPFYLFQSIFTTWFCHLKIQEIWICKTGIIPFYRWQGTETKQSQVNFLSYLVLKLLILVLFYVTGHCKGKLLIPKQWHLKYLG
jgi:hypothetical protein